MEIPSFLFWRHCFKCGKPLGGFKRYCSGRCKNAALGDLSRSRTGTKHSDSTRLKMSAAHKENFQDPEFKAMWDSVHSTPEAHANMSEAACVRQEAGKDFRVRGYHNSPKAGLIPYWSELEREMMVYFDDSSEVHSWRRGPRIEYREDYRRKFCLPDFLVYCLDGRRFCIEAKGDHILEEYLDHPKHQATSDWCRENGYTYVVVSSTDWLEDGWTLETGVGRSL